ncbi:hypothetical protein SAMN05216198_3396 [Halopseudomonas litoralis]|uniref:NADH:ubiquinone oxidoreductase n=1 Tax=Halopseudomonas litoralis TaxID=797277 RepID=A0A1H1WVL3_9GAMM|nr:hypothetical protein [Halopseudomonas litoralis]SDT00690.1 hypothetical protein SAMN05216198_3396 [Halopseudomonas litoralis]
MNRCLFLLILLCISTAAQSAACLIESNDDALPIRMCQQNISIPPQLFTDSFCQPQIAERSFDISFLEQCPEGAYGICDDAQSEGVGYRQAIHYYSEPGDKPVLKAYCEQFSQGRWRSP